MLWSDLRREIEDWSLAHAKRNTLQVLIFAGFSSFEGPGHLDPYNK